jgi:hypothetical protein
MDINDKTPNSEEAAKRIEKCRLKGWKVLDLRKCGKAAP